MLYEAIFVEDGAPLLPKSIIKNPSLSKYVADFGSKKLDIGFIAEADEKPIGAIWGRLFTEEDKGYGFVDSKTPELSIAVKHQYRNKGIGTKLINRVTDSYRDIGVKYVSLSVDKKNIALNLYKRVGFKIIAETEKSVVMRKKI